MAKAPQSTVDSAPRSKFRHGPLNGWTRTASSSALHNAQPLPLDYITTKSPEKFDRDLKAPQAVSRLRILDIGCGGRLLS